MAENSAIEWTDNTANFWWGCLKVSPGCKNCYAERLSTRYGKTIWGAPGSSSRELKKGIWAAVPKWDREARDLGIRKKMFVMSMGDFLEDHPQVIEWRNRAIDLLWSLTNTDVQLLTKRPENASRFLPQAWFDGHWPAHIWMGTSIEDQEQADKRIPELLRIPAAVRFLSCEPLLAPIDLSPYLHCRYDHNNDGDCHIHRQGCPRIHQVIVGGESGPNARPMHMEWVYDIVQQCKSAGAACFVKQMGDNPYYGGDSFKWWLGSKGKDIDKWPTSLQVREFSVPAQEAT